MTIDTYLKTWQDLSSPVTLGKKIVKKRCFYNYFDYINNFLNFFDKKIAQNLHKSIHVINFVT